jgi:hypothetical protein
MSTRHLRLILGAIVVGLLIVGVVATRLHKHSSSPSPQQHAAQQQAPPVITSAKSLYERLPRVMGPLRRQAMSLAPHGAGLPECIQHTAGLVRLNTPQSPLTSYEIEPILETSYTTPRYVFQIQVFRFEQSKLGRVHRIVNSAALSCTSEDGSLLFTRLHGIYGDDSADYQSYVIPSRHRQDLRSADTIEMLMVSKSWALSISTLPMTYLQDALGSAQIINQQLPTLLRSLDSTLGTSFWPPNGRQDPISFPPQQAYLAAGGNKADPTYRPSAIWLSGDSTFSMNKLHWSSWTTRSATGTGTVMVNLCQQTCAGGPIRHYAAHVTLSDPRYECSFLFFEHVRFHWLASQPPGMPQDYLWKAIPSCTG